MFVHVQEFIKHLITKKKCVRAKFKHKWKHKDFFLKRSIKIKLKDKWNHGMFLIIYPNIKHSNDAARTEKDHLNQNYGCLMEGVVGALAKFQNSWQFTSVEWRHGATTSPF